MASNEVPLEAFQQAWAAVPLDCLLLRSIHDATETARIIQRIRSETSGKTIWLRVLRNRDDADEAPFFWDFVSTRFYFRI